jgi:Tetracyclin repressor-like, C-terminal domain
VAEAEPGADARTHLHSLVARFVAWHAHHHVAARVSQYELGALAPGHCAEILELRRQCTAIFRQAVIRGIDEGTFAPVDVHRVVRAIRSGGPDSPERLGEFYADLALGMVTSAGNNAASRAAPGFLTAPANVSR